MIASGLVETDVDAHGLESLLAYGSVAGPRTMLSGVRLLEPGTFARIDTSETMSPSRVRPKRYWEFSATPQVTGDVARVAHALAPALRESVRSHLVSDVPVAVFLSGGIDSTVIAALAS
jgi:asparagine synthase (glutamine-hydrolysing)